MDYKVTLKVLNGVFTAQGDSVIDALSKLTPSNCKGRGILTIEHNGTKKDRILMQSQLMRLFTSSKLMREIALKNLSSLF